MVLRPHLSMGLPLTARYFRLVAYISAPDFQGFSRQAKLTSKTWVQISSYLIRSKILNIGMYNAMTMAPTMPPSTAIMMGSISEVSCSVVDSTS